MTEKSERQVSIFVLRLTTDVYGLVEVGQQAVVIIAQPFRLKGFSVLLSLYSIFVKKLIIIGIISHVGIGVSNSGYEKYLTLFSKSRPFHFIDKLMLSSFDTPS